MPIIVPYVPKLGTVLATTAATLEEPKAALSGAQSTPSSIASTLQKPIAALSGSQLQTGTAAATITKPVAAFTGSHSTLSTIASTLEEPTAALVGSQLQTGTMAASVTKPVTALAGAQPFSGTINATTPKVTSSVMGGSFVTRDTATGNLLLNGQRIRFGGANAANDIGLVSSSNGNAYGGTVHSGLYLTPHSQIDAVLDAAEGMNATYLRLLSAARGLGVVDGIQPSLGVFNSAGLDPLDYALQQCALREIRLIPVLSDEYSDKQWYVDQTGGGAADLFYTRAACISAFKAHIGYILDHVNPYTGLTLKNDPYILAWQLGNELTASTITNVQYATWLDDIGGYIKVTKGAQQLVQDGHYGIKSGSLGATYIDIYDEHAYDQFRTPDYLLSEAGLAHAAGKAYFVGEFDWTDAAVHSSVWRLDQQLDIWERSSLMDGDAFWDLLAPLTTWGDGYTLHYPPDNANMQTRGEQLADHALRMAGLGSQSFLSDSFTGSNGTVLSSHVGELGATWNLNDSWTGVATIQSNRLYGSATETHYYSSGVPDRADYTVSADIYIASVTGYAGVAVRSFTKTDASYVGYVWNNAGSVTCRITWYPGDNNLGSTVIATPTVGTTHNLKLKISNSTLSLFWDDVLVVGPVTDSSPYRSAGRAGIIMGGGGSSTTGFHIDNISGAYVAPLSYYPPVKRPNYGSLIQL